MSSKKEKQTNDFNQKHKLLFSILIISNIVFLLLFILNTNKIQKQISKYNFLSPQVLLSQYQDGIVNFQKLRESLQSKYENHDTYLIAIYFEYLPTGANINVNKDTEIWPASLIKIPIAMSVMKKIEEQKWKLSNELVIMDEDKDSEFGDLYKQPTGTTLTIENLLKETLVNSDNTAHFVLLRNLDADELRNTYEHLGLLEELDTVISGTGEGVYDNKITAKNYSIFFRSLFNSTYLSPEYSQMFLNMLAETKSEYLELGIPDNVEFTHKTGIRSQDAVWTDAGIVYVPKRPYLLTVMIQAKNPDNYNSNEVNILFKDISKEIYTYVISENL